jgi:hypothetical protein
LQMLWHGTNQERCLFRYQNLELSMPRTLRSGFCIAGHCEGTRPKSPSGVPMKVCIDWLGDSNHEPCPCECHQKITEMYKVAGLPRETFDNPEYAPHINSFYMPQPGIDYAIPIALSTEAESNGPHRDSAPATVTSPATATLAGRSFDPTPSGRLARGELESQVLEVVNGWLIDSGGFTCTVYFIQNEIARVQHEDPPSTGAISNTLRRWGKWNFAVIQEHPLQLIGLTEEGRKQGLPALKYKAKVRRRRKR